ncbi:DUF2158 domain-containing protein [Rhizobium skierniewicense]|uniref:DUF2158 domain-containing protein n=1 Tax=Rhizobium skierniewicense TaxID=984260 RepID=UPI001574B6DF|nr:DUF2158 domain-containing protein [Rhizobium skierniewicense]NTF34304.1 DUF2158 domain-containing protein [Rhizobium skierniewicense]
MAETFSLGDVVTLKSGGPLMTVDAAHTNGNFAFMWFNKNEGTYTLESKVIKGSSLKKQS